MSCQAERALSLPSEGELAAWHYNIRLVCPVLRDMRCMCEESVKMHVPWFANC